MIKIINSKKKAAEMKIPDHKEAADHDIPTGKKWNCRECNSTLSGGINNDILIDKLINGQEVTIKFLEIGAKCKKCKTENVLFPDYEKLIGHTLDFPSGAYVSPFKKKTGPKTRK